MARDLNLKVKLEAIDKALGPIKAITQGSGALAKALQANRDQLKALNQQQRDITAYRTANVEIVKQTRAIQDLQTKTRGHTELLERQRTAHVNLKGNLKAAQTQYNKLARALIDGKGNTAEFHRELEKAQIKLQSSQQAFTRSASTIKTYQNRIRSADDKLEQLNRQQQASQERLGSLKTKLDAAGIGTDGLGRKARELRGEQERLNTTLDKQRDKLKALGVQQERLAKARDSYGKSQQLAGSMASSGAAGLATGSGILYAGARMAAPGLEFDTTMSKVQSLTRLDKGDEQLAALRKQARDLGATTMFSAGDAASGMAFLAMAGFTPKAIQDAMPGLLDMAKAGDMELGLTADIASNILGGFRLDASQMGNVADILTKAFTTSNMSLEMLGETMKYVGPVASTAGMGLEEAAAMAGLLGNVGIQSSNAGTTLRAMLLRLAAPAGPAAKAMEKLGISAKDSQGNVRGITDVLGEVAKATEKMGSSDRLANLKAIFGEEPAAGMAELINQAGAGGILKYLDVIKDHQGAAAKTAKVMGDNMAGDLDELSSGLDDVRIEVFEQMNGTLRELTQTMTSVVGRIGAWVKENPGMVKQIMKTVAGLGMLMAVGGSITLMLASILGPIAMVSYGLKVMGIVATGSLAPMFLVIGVIAAIAGAAYLIYRNWDTVGPYFQAMWAWITGIFRNGTAQILGFFKAAFSQVAGFYQAVFTEIQTAVAGGLAGVGALILNWSPLGLLYKAFAGVMDYLGFELPGKFTEFGGMLIDGLVNGITGALGGVKDAIVGAGSSAIGWFKETLGIHSPSRVFSELGGYTMEGLNQGLQRGENGPLSTLGTFGKNLAAAGAFSLAASSPLMADDRPITFDNRPPLAAQSSAPSVQVAGDTISLHIHAAPGMDENALARAVAAELDKRERAKAARVRSSMYDQE